MLCFRQTIDHEVNGCLFGYSDNFVLNRFTWPGIGENVSDVYCDNLGGFFENWKCLLCKVC